MVLCIESGLSHDDLETMTFGMALDYIDTYFEMKNPKNQKPKARKAQQSDFDNF